MTPNWLFIGGLHRSGTSLVHRLIRSHPDVTGFENTGVPEDEGQHLQTIYPKARDFGGPGRFCFDARSHMTEDSTENAIADRAELVRQWGPHLDFDKRMVVEKSPPNLVRTRYLQALFPHAKFVIVTRHPIVVSLATSKWCSDPLEKLVEHWCEGHRILLDDLPMIKSAIIVRYEDLVARPQGEADRVFEFANLPSVQISEAVGDTNAAYFRSPQVDLCKLSASTIHPLIAIPERFGYKLEKPYMDRYEYVPYVAASAVPASENYHSAVSSD